MAAVKSLYMGVVAAAAVAAEDARAAPLQPTSPWNLNYTATSCDATRRFGDLALRLTPAPLGESVRLMVEMPGRVVQATQYPARLFHSDRSSPKVITTLLFPLSQKGLRGLYSVLPKSTVDEVLAKGELDIRVGSATAMGSKLNYTTARVHLALGKSGALVKALDTCLVDLQKQWGMVAGKLPEPAVAGKVIGTLASIFTSDDYPMDAIEAGHSGKTDFLLMIGARGEVMDCVVRHSSGIASLDAMGCQVIRERAKFEPARDSAGKPTVSTMLQSVAWILE